MEKNDSPSRKLTRVRRLVRRRRRPGEVCSPRLAILNHCRECMGWVRAEVEKCTAPNCWLWPVRRPGPASLEGEDIELMRRGYCDASRERFGDANVLPDSDSAESPEAGRFRAPESTRTGSEDLEDHPAPPRSEERERRPPDAKD